MNGKKKKLIKTLRCYHREAVTNRIISTPNLGTIKSGITRTFNKKSTNILMGGTLEVVKVRARFAAPSKFEDFSQIKGLGYHVGGFTDNNFKLGEDGHFDFNTTRIITKIKIECISNVNSEINQPKLYLNKSKTSPATQESYEAQNDAFRLNPGGFVGFNLVSFENTLYKDGTNMEKLKDKEHLFKQGTFYHSEIPFETDNLEWKIGKKKDIALLPHFDWFHSLNASYILSNGAQTITVSKPYYQFNVNIDYFEL